MPRGQEELSEAQRLALEEVKNSQAQFNAVAERMTDFKLLFREERDAALRKAADLRVPKALLARELNTTTVWVNKILRGEAYRRSSD